MKKFKFSLLLLLLSIYFLPSLVLAADPTAGNPTAGNPASSVQLTNPLTGNTNSKSVPELLGTIINYAMGIIGSLALVMFIYGGITWMLSGGSQEQVTKGKQIIIWATLGIAIIFMSYALVKFVITAIGGSTGV